MPQQPDSSIRIRFQEEVKRGARIKVIGVGGGGNNAVNRMILSGMEGVEFISMNTDLQSLQQSNAKVRVQLGAGLTHGLGTGSNLEIARRAAIEDSDKILAAVEGSDMVFVTAGLGGGTGTGVAPVVAAIARQMGALTVAIVTTPFGFEGKRRKMQAERGVQELLDHSDTLIVIPNEKLLTAAQDTGFFDSFKIADDVLRQAVQGISEIITVRGVINRDFADVRTTMAGMGYAVMGTATRSGPNRATEAATAAMTSPLLEAGAIDGARGILINISGSSSLKLSEVSEASTIIQRAAHGDANIIFGAVLDERLEDAVKVTVIAAGFRGGNRGYEERGFHVHKGVEPTLDLAVPVPAELCETEVPQAELSEMAVVAESLPVEPVWEQTREPETEELSIVSRDVEASIATVQEEDRTEAVTGNSAESSESLFEPAPDAGIEPAHEAGVVEQPAPFGDGFEEDLLANIDGPAFDFSVGRDEAESFSAEGLPSRPEFVKLRQTAIAAYTATSIAVADDEVADVPSSASFAGMLADREKALDASLAVEDVFGDLVQAAMQGAEEDKSNKESAESATLPLLGDGSQASAGPKVQRRSIRSILTSALSRSPAK